MTPIVVHPDCCDDASKGAVFLGRVYDTVSDEDYTSLKVPPVWCIMLYENNTTAEVKFCPFCGKNLPKIIKKRKLPKKLVKITDGGYYCDTCGERLDQCACAGTVQAYKPRRGHTS